MGRRHGKGRRFIRAAALLLPLVVGCAFVQTSADYDRGVDFSKYHTFAIRGGKLTRAGVGPGANTMVRDRIATAITDELSARGLRPAADSPDLEIRFVGATRNTQALEGSLTPLYGPYYAGPVGTDVWVRDYQQGRLVIDMVDGSNNKLVWRSVATAEDQDFTRENFIRKAVRRSLAQFPRPKG
jgi:hypothetical protein